MIFCCCQVQGEDAGQKHFNMIRLFCVFICPYFLFSFSNKTTVAHIEGSFEGFYMLHRSKGWNTAYALSVIDQSFYKDSGTALRHLSH